MIRNILFDLDDTLFDFHEAERQAISKTMEQLGIEPTPTILNRYSEINLSQWKLLEKGVITRPEVKSRRYRILFDELGINKNPEEANHIYESFLAIGHFYMTGAKEILEKLKGRYTMYIVSNGTAAVQRSRIGSSDLTDYVEDIFISEEIGFNKPKIEFFEACFKQIDNFNINEAVIIGDSLSSDIQGGINAGLTTIWFNPRKESNTSDIRPDYEINDLSELISLLPKLAQ